MSLFREEKYNEIFREKGYVVFPGFLNEEEVRGLRQWYFDHPLPDAKGFHATSHSKDPEYKRLVHRTITALMGEKAAALVQGYRPLTSSFTVKEVGPDSEFQFHLDWNMVDESKYISVTLWSPLVDTSARNGNLYVLEGSHKLGPTVRSGPGLYLYVLNDNYKTAKFKKRVLELKAGDMVLYDHRVFHGSPANLSDEVRVSFNHVMIPEHVASIHYTQCSPLEVNAWVVDDDFYNRYEIGRMPEDVTFLERLHFDRIQLNQDEVNNMVIE